MGGINHEVQNKILNILGMSRGEFPVKYLIVLLTTRKLRYSEYRGLVDKLTTRVSHWSSKTLSYAGRLQLINSVLINMQSYWGQIFVFPKKLFKEVVAICRSFLWRGGVSPSPKALIAWSAVCLPKSCGGLTFEIWCCGIKRHLLKCFGSWR